MPRLFGQTNRPFRRRFAPFTHGFNFPDFFKMIFYFIVPGALSVGNSVGAFVESGKQPESGRSSRNGRLRNELSSDDPAKIHLYQLEQSRRV